MITHRLSWSQWKQTLPNNQISTALSNMDINVENPSSESLFTKYCSLTRKCSSTRPKTYSTSLNRRLAISIWPAIMNIIVSPQKFKAIGIHKRKYNLTLLRFNPCQQAFVSLTKENLAKNMTRIWISNITTSNQVVLVPILLRTLSIVTSTQMFLAIWIKTYSSNPFIMITWFKTKINIRLMSIMLINTMSMMTILEAFQMLCHSLVTKSRAFLLVTLSNISQVTNIMAP